MDAFWNENQSTFGLPHARIGSADFTSSLPLGTYNSPA
jgi:hypothetical protein